MTGSSKALVKFALLTLVCVCPVEATEKEQPSPAVCIHHDSPEKIRWMDWELRNDSRLSGIVTIQGAEVSGGLRVQPGRHGVDFVDLIINPGQSSAKIQFADQTVSTSIQSKQQYRLDVRVVQGLLVIEVDGHHVFENIQIPVATEDVQVGYIAAFDPEGAVGIACFQSWVQEEQPPTRAPLRFVE